MFENIEEASGFWRKLWEERGTGNKNVAWLQEVKIAIYEQVPPPTASEWALKVAEAVKVLSKKRNWSAPGPDKITNFWWKHAGTLHKGVVDNFKEVSKSNEDYPKWFSEGKTSLIPKEGEFLIENQRPITRLNNMYKWFTSCLLAPVDQHLEHYGLIEGQQRGAKSGCFGTMDNLLIDRAVMLDCQRGKQNLSMAWIDERKAYVHVKSGAQVLDESGMGMDETTTITALGEGKHYKFLGVLENVRQDERLALACAAKEYLRRISIIWSSPLSDCNRVQATNQYALPVLQYLMWTKHWSLSEL